MMRYLVLRLMLQIYCNISQDSSFHRYLVAGSRGDDDTIEACAMPAILTDAIGIEDSGPQTNGRLSSFPVLVQNTKLREVEQRRAGIFLQGLHCVMVN